MDGGAPASTVVDSVSPYGASAGSGGGCQGAVCSSVCCRPPGAALFLILSSFSSCSPFVLQVFPKFPVRFLHVFYGCFTCFLLMFSRCSPDVLCVFYMFSPDALHIFSLCFLDVLHVFSRCSPCFPQVFSRCFLDFLHVFNRCSPCFLQMIYIFFFSCCSPGVLQVFSRCSPGVLQVISTDV